MARQIKDAEPSWTLQDAKNRFSAVVDAARRGQPQMVTRRGAPAVVVVAAEDYARLRTIERQAQPSFVDHLLAMPCDDQTFERIDADLRLTEL
jgi:prevent-host-death family protein